jgi:hypothetical protein
MCLRNLNKQIAKVTGIPLFSKWFVILLSGIYSKGKPPEGGFLISL